MTIKLGILDAVPPEYLLPDEKTEPEKFVDMFDAVDAPFDYSIFDSSLGSDVVGLDGDRYSGELS